MYLVPRAFEVCQGQGLGASGRRGSLLLTLPPMRMAGSSLADPNPVSTMWEQGHL